MGGLYFPHREAINRETNEVIRSSLDAADPVRGEDQNAKDEKWKGLGSQILPCTRVNKAHEKS